MKTNLTLWQYFYTFSLFLCLFEIPAQAQTIENDICATAQIFDQILAEGDMQCIMGTTIDSNVEYSNLNQANCASELGFNTSTHDVWYQVTSQGNLLDVTITDNSEPLLVALYENVCDSLIGRFCQSISTSSSTHTFAPVSPNQTYYIQIINSTSSSTAENFSLCLSSYENFDEVCMRNQTLNVNPAPILATYQPGQEVTFCLTIDGYVQNSADWFHGLVPVFSTGWDMSTLSVAPPPSCDGVGYWAWYDLIQGIGGNSVGPKGPGFFYERTSLEMPPNPGNNFGDNSEGDECNWEFCFTLSTMTDCPQNLNEQDLSIVFNNYSDSETGSWSGTNSPCPNDPSFIFKAVLACCKVPNLMSTSTTCNDSTSGSIIAMVETGTPPYTFQWSNGFTETTDSVSFIDSLTAGYYQLTVTDNNNCQTTSLFGVDPPSTPNLSIVYEQTVTCPNGNGQLTIAAEEGIAPYIFVLIDDQGDTLTINQTGHFMELSMGNFTVEVEDAAGCFNTIESSLPSSFLNANAISAASTSSSGNGSIELQTTGGVPPYLYSLNGGTMQSEPIFSDLAEGTYTIQLQDFLGCQVEQIVTIEQHVLSVEETTTKQQFEIGSIYPNPSKGLTTISLTSSKNGQVKIALCNVLEQTTLVHTGTLQQGAQDIFINTQHLTSGVYLLEVFFEGEKQVKKLVVQ